MGPSYIGQLRMYYLVYRLNQQIIKFKYGFNLKTNWHCRCGFTA
jgi:hypothetical protein